RADLEDIAVADVQLLGGLGVQFNDRLPGDFRDWVWQFLEPWFVGSAAIAYRRAVVDDEVVIALGLRDRLRHLRLRNGSRCATRGLHRRRSDRARGERVGERNNAAGEPT